MKAPRGRISAELLDKIRKAVNLVEVVGEHVVLRKGGANHVGLCPFHNERSPSFSVSEQKQLYHCYGCKRGGDLFSFVMEIQGIGFPEAVEELADRARIALPKDWEGAAEGEDAEVAKRRAAQREKLSLFYRLNRFASAYYHHCLRQQPQVSQYFQKRAVSGEFARSFYVGSAPGTWDSLATHLVEKQAPLQAAVELGLIRPSKNGGRPGGPGYFDLFRNRAMFPIVDMRGKVCGFGGRLLPPEFSSGPASSSETVSESPKYLNSPESPVFQKSKVAFGLFQAQKHIREQATVVLVEGYFDVLAMHAAGFQHVVATCGTALTSDHLNLFKRLSARVILLFDGDRAGVSATERAMEIGLAHGAVLYGASMPSGLDPDEVLFDLETGAPRADGAARMKGILEAARPLLDDRIAAAVKSAEQGPEARTQALKQIASWLASFTDPVGREVRMDSVLSELRVDRQLLLRAMSEGPGGHDRSPDLSSTGRGRVEIRSSQPGQAPASPHLQSSLPTQAPRTAQPQQRRPEPPGRNQRPGPNPLRPQKPKQNQGLAPREKLLLCALACGSRFWSLVQEAGRDLPPKMSLVDLFEYPAARHFLTLLEEEPSRKEAFRMDPAANLALLRDLGLDSQVHSILTEAAVAGDSTVDENDLKAAIQRCAGRAWARFSQQIKAALAEAEAKKDAGLQSQLMKEYLDVQRKMKEFSSFYDEA